MARGNITNIRQQQEYDSVNYPYGFRAGTAAYYATAKAVNTVEMECDFDRLAVLVDRFVEFEQMMSDPECRELINQAKFVNRLRNGVNFEPL
jgi:hypothetical protein